VPTYEDLRAYFQESSVLQETVSGVSKIPIVSGFILDVNPLWSYLYDIENNLTLAPQGHWFPYWDDFFRWLPRLGHLSFMDNLENLPGWRRTGFQGYRRRDLYSKVGLWEEAVTHLQPPRRVLPVTMTVVHRPIRAPEKESKEGQDDQAQLIRLVGALNQAPVVVRLVERRPARLASAQGITSQSRKSGTLGGVLKDNASGKSYGLTCDHVASSGQAVSDSGGSLIGKCSASTSRVLLRNATVCDPVNLVMPNPFPGNGPDLNTLDCSIVELSSGVSCPPVAGVAKALCSGQDVVLYGASTQKTQHKLGSLCLSYTFKDGAKDYCFRDSIELLPQPWGPFGGTLGSMMTTVPTQGDSGGWVLTDDQPQEWAGMFFGEDGSRGFVIRASWVHDWAEKTVGRTLTF
jgi:hypothetical protein